MRHPSLVIGITYWAERDVCVTGAGSFIGRHLVNALLARGAIVRAVLAPDGDPVEEWAGNPRVQQIRADLRQQFDCRAVLKDPRPNVVFHLAAKHGGRGYITLHRLATTQNLLIDATMLAAAVEAGVSRFVYAGSGCVYPPSAQAGEAPVYLREGDVGPPYDPDSMYGWAKLTMEKALAEYVNAGEIEGSVLRIFQAYGPGMNESHALGAMIARAHARQDPFVVWGDGRAVRNYTYVSDIVDAFLLAAERVRDGRAFNVGTNDRISVDEAARTVCRVAGHAPLDFRHRVDMPTGPTNRSCDYALAASYGWAPQVSFAEGVRATYEWYASQYSPAEAAARLAERDAEECVLPSVMRRFGVG